MMSSEENEGQIAHDDGAVAMELAVRLCELDRSNGGDRAVRGLLGIVGEYVGGFSERPLFYGRSRKPGPPVVYAGTDPLSADVIISAHYDTLGFKGGCDNTSGVVAVIMAAAALGGRVPDGVSLALLPREEPPFFNGSLMGSNAVADGHRSRPRLFVAVDTIGGECHRGGRMLEVCCDDPRILPDGWTDGMVVCKRHLHRLSDASNFMNGVLLTDERVLDVPMHTYRDTVDRVDWSFVMMAADRLVGLVGEASR